MSYESPFLNPGQYVTSLGNLSSEGVTIDAGVARAVHEAKDFSGKYSADFARVADLAKLLQEFEPRWVKDWKDSRDAASATAGWMRRFNEVFLSMINDIVSEGDAKDVATEFKSLLGEGHPSDKYQLDGTPGPKQTFQEIEKAVDQESNHIIDSFQNPKDWQKTLEEIKQKLPEVQKGVNQIRSALESYAVKLEA